MENPIIQKMGEEFDHEFDIGTREVYRDRKFHPFNYFLYRDYL